MHRAGWLLLVCTACAVARGAPMATCWAQRRCIDVSVVPNADAGPCPGAGCSYTACLTVNLGGVGCRKDGTVSYSCVKDETVCNAIDWFRGDGTVVENIGDGHTQCQTGAGGTSVQFLLKDGRGCRRSTAQYTDASLPGGTAVTCAGQRVAGTSGCTGNAKGCVWTVDLPDCAPTPAPYTPAPQPTPAPYTPAPQPTPAPYTPAPQPIPEPCK